MAHFAEIDENNVVLRVLVVNNDVVQNLPFPESEPLGIEFCQNILGGQWLQTSYNANFRKNYASIGYTYRADLDAFVAPQPNPACMFDDSKAAWVCPPEDGANYVWNPETKSFDFAVVP
jgi:hypothetical protein